MEIDQEKLTLIKADKDISDAHERIRRQEEIVRELEMDGHDTQMARDLLVTLQTTLSAMLEHRELIILRIKSLENSGN
jgi:hypothetical protein